MCVESYSEEVSSLLGTLVKDWQFVFILIGLARTLFSVIVSIVRKLFSSCTQNFGTTDSKLLFSVPGALLAKCFPLKMSGSQLEESGGMPLLHKEILFNLEINLVQSGWLFNKIFGCTYMSLSQNECELPWNGTLLFSEISEIAEKRHPCSPMA